MPPAASGSENPPGKTARKASSPGPKRTPRPDDSGNGSAEAPATQKGVPTTTVKSRPGPKPADTSTAPGDAGVVGSVARKSPAVQSDATASLSVVDPAGVDPTVVGPSADDQDRRRPKPPRPSTDPDLVTTGRRKGRRVRRVLRRIDLWSVLKLAIVLYTCLYAAVMATLALLWGLAYSSGQIEKVQSFMADVGMDNYRFYGDQMWRACAMIGAIGVLAATVITVLTAALVNVISEMTGGIRLVIIEEDPPPRRR